MKMNIKYSLMKIENIKKERVALIWKSTFMTHITIKYSSKKIYLELKHYTILCT